MQLTPTAAALALFAVSPLFALEDCCAPAASAAAPTAAAASSSSGSAQLETAQSPAGHPLRGIVVAVLPEKSALLVKHEEIPGVMAAMTMLLKVDAATLATAQKGQAIAATLVKLPDGWWLRDVKAAATADTAK